jgi:hypothetical protein
MKSEGSRMESAFPWPLIVGPGASELRIMFDGGDRPTHLQCPGCKATIRLSAQGIHDVNLLHESWCPWLTCLENRMRGKEEL